MHVNYFYDPHTAALHGVNVDAAAYDNNDDMQAIVNDDSNGMPDEPPVEPLPVEPVDVPMQLQHDALQQEQGHVMEIGINL